jgi:predicted nucleic acid-binding Zn ribbon protein
MKKPIPLRSVLEQTLKGLELEVPIRTHSIWSAWGKIVGEPIALHTQPHAIRNRILFVEVSHPTWMQQLQFLKPTLLGKINGFLEEFLVEDIRFKVGKISQAGTPPKKEQMQGREEKLDRKTIDRIEQLMENITDGEVKRKFRELLIKSAKVERSRKKSE